MGDHIDMLNMADLLAELIYKLNEMICIDNKHSVFFRLRDFRRYSDAEAQ